MLHMCVSVCEHRYGVVLRKLDLLKEAMEVFVEAIHALPLHWGAWLELSNLVTNIEMVTPVALTCTQTVALPYTPFTKKHQSFAFDVFSQDLQQGQLTVRYTLHLRAEKKLVPVESVQKNFKVSLG